MADFVAFGQSEASLSLVSSCYAKLCYMFTVTDMRVVFLRENKPIFPLDLHPHEAGNGDKMLFHLFSLPSVFQPGLWPPRILTVNSKVTRVHDGHSRVRRLIQILQNP